MSKFYKLTPKGLVLIASLKRQSDLKVLFSLVGQMQYGNEDLVLDKVAKQQMADELKVTLKTVHRSLSALKKMGALNGGASRWRVNPELILLGTVKHKADEKRQEDPAY